MRSPACSSWVARVKFLSAATSLISACSFTSCSALASSSDLSDSSFSRLSRASCCLVRSSFHFIFSRANAEVILSACFVAFSMILSAFSSAARRRSSTFSFLRSALRFCSVRSAIIASRLLDMSCASSTALFRRSSSERFTTTLSFPRSLYTAELSSSIGTALNALRFSLVCLSCLIVLFPLMVAPLSIPISLPNTAVICFVRSVWNVFRSFRVIHSFAESFGIPFFLSFTTGTKL